MSQGSDDKSKDQKKVIEGAKEAIKEEVEELEKGAEGAKEAIKEEVEELGEEILEDKIEAGKKYVEKR